MVIDQIGESFVLTARFDVSSPLEIQIVLSKGRPVTLLPALFNSVDDGDECGRIIFLGKDRQRCQDQDRNKLRNS